MSALRGVDPLVDRLLTFVWPPYGLPEESEPEPEAPGPDVREAPQLGDPFAPTSFAEFRGQEEAVRLLRTEVEAARREGRPLSHVLLYGAPGTGKTSLAFVLAAEMGGLPVYASSGAEFGTQRDLIETLGRVGQLQEQAGLPVIFLIDEIDGVPRVASYVLHSLMTHGFVTWQGVKYDCRGTTIIGTTNHAAAVPAALFDRFPIAAKLGYYAPAELAIIATQAARRRGLELSEEAARFVGENAGGEPRKVTRTVLTTLLNILAGRPRAELEDARRAVELAGLRPRGLTRSQYDYLRFLSQCEKHGCHGAPYTAGLNSIAAYLAEPVRTVQFHAEPFLIRSGLAMVTRGGRALTAAGLAYLEGQT